MEWLILATAYVHGVCIYMHGCTYTCVWRPEDKLRGLFLKNCPPCLFETGSLIDLEFTEQARTDWPEIHLLSIPSIRITNSYCAHFVTCFLGTKLKFLIFLFAFLFACFSLSGMCSSLYVMVIFPLSICFWIEDTTLPLLSLFGKKDCFES